METPTVKTRRKRKSRRTPTRRPSAPPSAPSAPSAPAPTISSPGGDLDAPVGAPSPVDARELAQLAAAVRAEGDRVAVAAGDTERVAADAEQDVVDAVERFASGDGAAIAALTEDEIADLFQLGFGFVADARGKHWELHDRSARRLGKWFKRVLDRHGWEWVAKWLPDVMAVGVLGYEIGKRWRADKALAAERAERSGGTSGKAD